MSATQSLKEIYANRERVSNLKSARILRKKIFTATNRLKAFSKLGKLVEKPRFKKQKIRFLIEGNYKIFYRIIENEVEILNVTDSRKDPDKSVY